MTFTEMALRMYPFWIMGLLMIYATYHSKFRDLLRVEWKPVLKWCAFLGFVTIYRIVVFKLFAGSEYLQNLTSGAMTIPWQATLTVFWEDMCHGLPLAVFSLALGKDSLWKKVLTWLAVIVVMVSFGLGHTYQGYFAAAFLSLYVPYTFKKGQEVGFGTVMICHTLYDLVTVLTLQNFLG